MRKTPVIIFIITVIGSGILEFATGYVLYHYFGGMRLWDYNTEIWNWGNIDGFVCARSVLIFGLFGAVYGTLVVPPFLKFIKKVKARPLVIFSSVLAVLVLADVIVGYFIKPMMNGGL